MTDHPLQAAPRQQALALGLSALVTAGLLAGLLGLAGSDSDSAARLAQLRQQRQQAVAPGVASPTQLASRT